MSNVNAATMADVARDVIASMRQSAHRLVDSGYVAAGVLEFAHRAAVAGIAKAAAALGADGNRFHTAINGAVAEAKAIATGVIGGGATAAREATDGIARAVDAQLPDRIDALFDGRATRSIERMALPAAEIVRAAGIGINALADGVYDFPMQRKSRRGRKDVPARRRLVA